MDPKKPRTNAEIKVFQLIKGGKDDPGGPYSQWQQGYDEGHKDGHFEGRDQGQREGWDAGRRGTLEHLIEQMERRAENSNYHNPETETAVERAARIEQTYTFDFVISELKAQLYEHNCDAAARELEKATGMEESWLEPQGRGR